MWRRSRVIGVVIALPLVVMLLAVALVGRAGRARELPEVLDGYRRAGLVATEHSQLLWNLTVPLLEETRFARALVVNGAHRADALNVYALRADPDGFFPALGCGCVAYTEDNTVVCAAELLAALRPVLRDTDPARGQDATSRLAQADLHGFAFQPGDRVYRPGVGGPEGGPLSPPVSAADLERALGADGLNSATDQLHRTFALELLRWLVGREVAHVVQGHETEPPGQRQPGSRLRAPGEAEVVEADQFTADRADGTSPDSRAFMLRSLVHTLYGDAAGGRAGDLGRRDAGQWPAVTVGTEPGGQPPLLVRATDALRLQALAIQQPDDLEFALDVTGRVRVARGAGPVPDLCGRSDPPRLSSAILATAEPADPVDKARERLDWAREYLELDEDDRALGVLDEAAAELRGAGPPSDGEVSDTLADVIHLRGFVQLVRGDWERTLTDSLEATRLDPGEAFSWDNAGFAYFELGRYQEAAAAFERAVTLRPSTADAWAGLGISLARQGRGQEAVDAFTRAINIDQAYSSLDWLRHEWYWSDAQRCVAAELQRQVRGEAPSGRSC